MERIVYILGAGFSAPLGLPVMSNFLTKSRDQLENEKSKFSYFEEIINKIDNLSQTKNFFNADLFNVEEVLSILEMMDVVQGDQLLIFSDQNSTSHQEMSRFLLDVVNYYTPAIMPYDRKMPSNWEGFLFGRTEPAKFFGYFFASLFHANYSRQDAVARKPDFGSFSFHPKQNIPARYGIVTLNYDLVPENYAKFLSDRSRDQVGFQPFQQEDSGNWSRAPYLAKLHGGSDTQVVIPPTWNKRLLSDIAAV